MSLQEEIIKEAKTQENGFVVMTGDYAFSEDELDHIITKVCDACIQAITDNPHKNPIEAIADMRRKDG